MAKQTQVTITTAHALTDQQKKWLKTRLTKKLGEDYLLKTVVDSKSIGGLKITINGQVKDATISGKISALESQLNQVKITVAVPLTSEQKKRIKQTLKTKYGMLNFQVLIDPQIIGGIKLSLGFNEYDATLKTKLEKLKNLLLAKL